MPRSLRARLLLTVGGVVALCVVAVGLFSSSMTRIEFRHFLELVSENSPPLGDDADEIRASLREHFEREGSWSGVTPLLERIQRSSDGVTGVHLADAQGRLAASATTRPDLKAAITAAGDLRLERTRATDASGPTELLLLKPQMRLTDAAGRVIGNLFVVPAVPTADDLHRSSFIEAIDRWLIVGVAAAGAVAILVTALLARRILAPIETLTAAARRMAAGDLDLRVAVRSRDEVGKLGDAFNSMAASLQRTESLRRRMVGDVAHELRTPLTNIRCQLEALQDGLQPPTREVIDSLHEETMLLNRLIGDLQDLALAEAGQLRLVRRPLSAREEIDRAVAGITAIAASAHLVIDEAIDSLPPAHGDPDRFRQIVCNLLVNAITHTPAGGRIEIGARSREREIEIAVRDEGPGITPGDLPNVFERFYRADPSRSRATGGAGLGLAIVKQLVEAQGGRVWAEAVPGGGTAFSFTLPRADRITRG